MGHDAPGHLSTSSRKPLLRGLGQYHGKRGWGVSVEFDVKTGPVTLLGLGDDRGGNLSLVASEGVVTEGQLMKIGNTTSRVDSDCDPGEWVDEWSDSGVGHHWSLLGWRQNRLTTARLQICWEFNSEKLKRCDPRYSLHPVQQSDSVSE